MRKVPVLDATQAAQWDRLAQDRHGIPARVLMESAGRACAATMTTAFPDAVAEGTVVAVGPGNNGGDGWVVARALAAVGIPCSVVSAADAKTPECIANRKLALDAGVPEFRSLSEAPDAGLLVDSLLGTGASGPLRGAIGRVAAELAGMRRPVVAIDGPTGLDLSTGYSAGGPRATMTLTFGGLRRGHLLNRDRCGEIVVLDIGFPEPLDEWPIFVDDRWAKQELPTFSSDMHKGDRGRVLIVGGNSGMSGAALHAARAAFSAGAGLVKLVADSDALEAARSSMPDVMTCPGQLTGTPATEILDQLEWADSLVVGPGLGEDEGTSAFVNGLVDSFAGPMVLDADALRGDLGALAAVGKRVVVTPHPGEFRRMMPQVDLDAVGCFEAAREACETLGATVLLKGVPTVIAEADSTLVVASGNPSLATGGSGDVLAGIIGSFLARGLAPPRAAALGAQVLGRSAEIASRSRTVRASRPADVIESIATYWTELDTPTKNLPAPRLLELLPPALV